ncbi:MAG TPA: asparagine synthase (glutamine-hydrolyzing) [Allosphingosinicella sp.]|jgi:asparagine synthase (glutamine-hydrolysing)
MCGICGAFSPSDRRPVAPAAIRRMSGAIAHRGPDDEGLFVDGHAGFGFRRLSIVDLATGHQPIANEDETLWLICNGEIFNHQALRDELIAAGHRFRTRSDSEVLIHLYEEMGDRLLERINGQFAFALYDKARDRMLLARDPFGVAPLFYTRVGETFVFASEIKAILAYPGVDRRVDLTGLDQILSLPGLVSPRTMFEGISSVPPGFALEVTAGGVKSSCYWDLVYPPRDEPAEARSEDSWREEAEEVLARSVRRRLLGDVPIGVYLSGGLDSSLITAFMAGNGGDPLRSFSIGFGDRMFDEGPYQRLVADRFGCVHRRIELPLDTIQSRLRMSVRHSECPVRETYNTASLALSEAARTHGVTVVLSGEGADELFAGYVGYRYDAFRRAAPSRSPPIAPREAELRRRLFGDESVFYERDLARDEVERRALYSPALRESFASFEFTGAGVVDSARLRGIHPQHQRSYLDLKLRLGDHLVGDHGDRMLLANAVEGRFPFLDVEVADLARRLPPDLALHGLTEKYILKQVGRAHLPAEIVEREKFAFNAPGSAYLLSRKIDWIEEMLNPETIRRQGYFDPAAVEALKRRALSEEAAPGGGNEDDRLMTVLTFGLFLEEFDMPEIGQ